MSREDLQNRYRRHAIVLPSVCLPSKPRESNNVENHELLVNYGRGHTKIIFVLPVFFVTAVAARALIEFQCRVEIDE